jgi:hypothetical protein
LLIAKYRRFASNIHGLANNLQKKFMIIFSMWNIKYALLVFSGKLFAAHINSGKNYGFE